MTIPAVLRASCQAGDLFRSQVSKLLELSPASSWWTLAPRTYANMAQRPQPRFFEAVEGVLPEELPKFRNATQHWIDREASKALVEPQNQKILTAGVIGVPNAGKSTLTNALIGRKVAAVSPKTNTTHQPTLGAFTEGDVQVVLHDTPGIITGKEGNEANHNTRVASAWRTAADCDLLLVILDADRQIKHADPRVARMVSTLGEEPIPGWVCPPTLLLLNKCDRIPGSSQPHLQRLIHQLEIWSGQGKDPARALMTAVVYFPGAPQEAHTFKDVYVISALQDRGLPELRQHLLDQAKPGLWKLGAAEFTDQWPEDIALELVREKIFLRLHEELPYVIRIRHESTKLLLDNSVRLDFDVLVPHDGVRGMLVGPQGAVIGKIGTEARQELEMLWQMRVHLFLKVSVDKS